MELEKIRNLSDEELPAQQTKSAEQLFRIRFQKSLGNNEGVKKLRTLKLDIARIQTIARERTVARVVNEVSGYLGNTPAVARASCIDPRVITLYEEGITIARAPSDLG